MNEALLVFHDEEQESTEKYLPQKLIYHKESIFIVFKYVIEFLQIISK